MVWMTFRLLPPVHVCYHSPMENFWTLLPFTRMKRMGKKGALLIRAAPLRRNYRVVLCSVRNFAMTRTSSTRLLSTLVPPLFHTFIPPHLSGVISHGSSSQVFLSTRARHLSSFPDSSSRVYYAIHHHLRRSTFCLQECPVMQHPVRCNLLGHHQAGKCLLLLLTCQSPARRVTATISGTWSSCGPLPSHPLPAAWPGCNIWCSSVRTDNGSTGTSFLI